MTAERDYVLGTHDDEVERLGLQHRLWRSRVLDAWHRAGFGPGQTILDVGCGPGWATLDLAEIVGRQGRVVAVDRSHRFLTVLQAALAARGIQHVATHEQDLDEIDLPVVDADGAWCRWVFAFVKQPRQLLSRIALRLRPGAPLVALEYFDYGTFGLVPPSADFDAFVQAVMHSWRRDGGEPDIGLRLPQWLVEEGFEIASIRPHVHVASPQDAWWQWPQAFVEIGLRRLVELGLVTQVDANRMAAAFAAAERSPTGLVITPAVFEIVAVRRR